MSSSYRHPKMENGWSEWLSPDDDGFQRQSCCDCGLVHDIIFMAVKVTKSHGTNRFDWKRLDPQKFRVMFRMRRATRSTSQKRRWMKEVLGMPYKSRSQQRAMHAKAERGEISKKTVKEFDKATKKQKGGFAALPQKAKAKKK